MKCAFCGAEYQPRSVVQKYCCTSCQKKAKYRGMVRYLSVTFQCAKCGKTVVTDPESRDRRSRFCSAECEKRYWRHPPHEHESARQNFRSVREYAAYERRTNEL